MANRFILNETSYFGPGSISVIPDEVAARGFKKAFVVTDKSLMQFKVATKVLKVLDDEYVCLDMNTNISPCVVKPETGDEYYYLILPVRLFSGN